VTAAAELPRADPARIERELAALWRAEAEVRQRLGSQKPLSRTLLHTLVVYAADHAAADEARQVAAALNPRQPARAVVIEAAPDMAPEALDAWVTLQCAVPRDGQEQVCGEQITLETQGAGAARQLAGAVLPLLLTNVPAFLWWQRGSPFGQPLLAALAPAIDRLVVDSFTFRAPEPDLAEMDRAISDAHFAPIVSDLSWARLAPWRYATAQIFDAAPVRPYLRRLRQARVRYAAGTPVLAWLFAAWLASRLGWLPAGSDAHVMRFAGGQTIAFEPQTVEGLAAGYFAGVRLEADDGATFDISRLGTTCTVTHQRLGALQTERVVPLRAENLSEWLGHELARLAPVPTYEDALRLLVGARRLEEDYIG
jgi:glucose-6-phosphate dehydrogenase assembly protein OpcA